MNDPRDDTPYTPPQSSLAGTPKPPRDAADGSLGAGIGLFFGSLLASVVFAIVARILLIEALSIRNVAAVMVVLFLVVPCAVPLALGIWLAATKRGRSALGMLVGFGIFVALVLLLVAACFGIVSTLNLD